MKKIILLVTSLLMFVMLTVGLTLSASAEDVIYTGTWGDNLTWELNETTGHLTISGEGEMRDYSSKTSTVAWRKHTETIKKVTIKKGVTNIGTYAFYNCKALECIDISDSVINIGWSAFADCQGLLSVTIPNSVTYIGQEAFSMCKKLTCITIPSSITEIGFEAFHGCTELKSITIPKGIQKIGFWAFGGCTSLEKIFFCGTEEEWDTLCKNIHWSSDHVSHQDYTTIFCPNHAWSEWKITKKPSAEIEGEREHSCPECEHSEIEKIATLSTHGCSASAAGSLSLLLLLPAAFALRKKKED